MEAIQYICLAKSLVLFSTLGLVSWPFVKHIVQIDGKTNPKFVLTTSTHV